MHFATILLRSAEELKADTHYPCVRVSKNAPVHTARTYGPGPVCTGRTYGCVSAFKMEAEFLA